MKHHLQAVLLLTLLSGSLFALSQQTDAPSAAASATVGILSSDETIRLMPSVVFFKGQSAPIQARNAAAVRFPSKALLLAALVDTSGYSSQIQERYQAYLIAEQAVSIDGHSLPAGAYGLGFLPGDSFVVMDIGGRDLFTAHSTPDPAMRRPRPLQILPDVTRPNEYRLYEGRSFVAIHPEQR